MIKGTGILVHSLSGFDHIADNVDRSNNLQRRLHGIFLLLYSTVRYMHHGRELLRTSFSSVAMTSQEYSSSDSLSHAPPRVSLLLPATKYTDIASLLASDDLHRVTRLPVIFDGV